MKKEIQRIKLVNYKIYRGRGRPRKIDYIYFNTVEEAIAYLIGEPVNIPLPIPIIPIFKGLLIKILKEKK